jgi:hypothetical protein
MKFSRSAMAETVNGNVPVPSFIKMALGDLSKFNGESSVYENFYDQLKFYF